MTNDALRMLLPIAGWPEERARAVEITGGTGPAILSGVGDQLSDRLSDGVRRAGGPRPPRARGWQLARRTLPGAETELKDVPKEFTPVEWSAGRWRATRRSVGCSISGRWCASPRRRRAGPGPRCRSVTTSRCGRRGPRSHSGIGCVGGHSYLGHRHRRGATLCVPCQSRSGALLHASRSGMSPDFSLLYAPAGQLQHTGVLSHPLPKYRPS